MVSLYFNDVLDTNSFVPRCILIDGLPLGADTEFLFNKNRRMVRFAAPEAEVFTLTAENIRSFDGRVLKIMQIESLERGAFYKYSREKRTWKKSSL